MLDIVFSPDRRFATIKLYGQLWQRQDMRELKDGVEKVKTQNIKYIVLDLDRLSFLDSDGLGVIIKVFNSLKEAGGQLLLFRPQGPVKDLLELSVVDSFIPVVETEKELNEKIAELPA